MKTRSVLFSFVGRLCGTLALAAVVLGGPSAAHGQALPASRQDLPNFDRRTPGNQPAALFSSKEQGKARLQLQVPAVAIDLDPLLQSPKHIRSTEGFLTGPNGRGRAVSEQAALAIPANDPYLPVKAFINEHATLFGHDATVLNNARTKRDSIDKHNGLRTVVWQQQVDGLDVFAGVLIGHITSQGELVSIASLMVPNPDAAADAATPNRAASQAAPAVNAVQAVQLASLNLGETVSPDQIRADGGPVGDGDYLIFRTPGRALVRMVYLPLSISALRLSWEVFATRNSDKALFRLLLDAETGEVYLREKISSHISDASYNVWTSDSPSPFTPGLQVPGNFQPPLIPRTLVTTPALDVVASPDGWIPDGQNTTTGNNVDAFPDRDFNGAPDPMGRPQGNPTRVFDLPLDLTLDPTNYAHASTVQFFYTANWYHDRLYQLGFTEASGNFQQNNFSRGGLGNDPVIAFVQAGADLGIANNAFFAPAPDGISGECAMFVWDFPNPPRDGSLDAEIVMHELTHGTSWRLVAGGMLLGSLQGNCMGEGWSDFYPMALLSEGSDSLNAAYASGGYACYNLGGFMQNYYFGIRRYPYSTDMSKSPFTFKDIDPAQIGTYPGVPRSPLWPFSPDEANEVHNAGEVWCVALWEVRANLISKYGWRIGNELALQLVTDGMKLTPPYPNFLQARDGILLADRINNGGANITEIWQGFAKRGMGVNATSPNGNSTAGVRESFDVPGLQVDRVIVLGGNDNRVVDPNECDELQIFLVNISGSLATGVTATLSTTNQEVIVVQPVSQYPVFPNNTTNVNLTPFRISIAPTFVCGMPIHFALAVKSDQDTTTNYFTLQTGVPMAPIRYNSTAVPVAIPDNDLNGTNSTIVVSNFSGAITKVTVSLHVTHTYNQDLTIQLISPDGVTNTLSANRGFNGRNYGVACSPDSLRTTFDDAATNLIGTANPPFIGSFVPEESLAVFNGKHGTNVNGTWLLRLVDDFQLDVGTLQCWSLFLSSAACTDGGGECPGSDMAVGMSAIPDPVIIGENMVYTINVTNNGPSSAKNVIVTHLLPTSAQFISGTSSQGTVSQAGGIVTANLGQVNARQRATVTVVAFPTVAGLAQSTATVASEQNDFNPANNTATVLSRVYPPTTDLAVGLSAAPNALILGQSFNYTVSVTNRGPSGASGVIVTNVLPPGVTYLSSTIGQGTVAVSGNTIVCTFGSLTNSARSFATITALATAEGQHVANASVRANQFDPVSTNNTASAQVVIGPAADLAIGLMDNPDPVVVRSNFTYLISVTNLGPSIATGVVVNQTLPTGITVVSTNTTQGSLSVAGGNVIANVGTLPEGATATITVRAFSANTATLLSSAIVSGSQPDPNGANNTAGASTVVMPPVVTIVAAGATLTAESVAPVNGALDIGEEVTVILRLRNAGNVNTTNLYATLLATNGVTPIGANEPQRYGVLPPSGFPSGKSFTFLANGTNGGTVTAWLALEDGAVTYPPVPFQFALPHSRTFANSNAIVINALGAATPYPSTNLVAGVTGTVSRVTATLANFSHSFPGDVNALLVGPKGTKTLLLSHAGKQMFTGTATLTFDDLAAAPLPENGGFASGSWKPSVYAPEPIFPAFAPPAPYNTALGAFNSIDPNGTWQIYVADEADGDQGAIANGWNLTITTVTPVNQVADVSLNVAAPSSVLAGSNIVYVFSVTNAGPNPASFVAFTNLVPAGMTIVSAQSSQGTVDANGSSVIGSLGSLSTGVTATVTVVLNPGAASSGQVTNTAIVAAAEVDLNQVNNSSAITTAVGLPTADVAASQQVAPSPVLVGSNVTLIVTVTNPGPGLALDVALTDTLPTGVSLVDASVSVGSVSTAAGTVVAQFGTLNPNSSATLTLVLGTSSVGSFPNSVQVVTGSTDPVLANNGSVHPIEVVNPSASIVAASAVLVSESFTPPNGTVEPGETVTVSLALKNVGSANTANLMATLQASGGVAPVAPAQKNYGQLVFGGAAQANQFTFVASGGNGEVVTATLQLRDGAADLGTVSFVFNLPAKNSFANNTAITIPESGPALLYPSTISVEGLSGNVSKVALSLNGVSHSFPRDLNVLLVSPAGARIVVMSHAGGANALTNINIAFDDAAAASLPGTNRISAGTYKPTAYGAAPVFPPSAPPAPYETALSVANGTNPNGTWSLFVLDDSVGDGGSISGGWSLEITTVSPVNPVSDLGVTIASAPATFYLGSAVTNVVSIANLGPAEVGDIVVSNSFASTIQVVSATSAQGQINLATNGAVWSVGTLAAGSTTTATLVLAPSLAGTFQLVSTVSGGVVDLNTGNSSAQASFTATEPTPAHITGGFEDGLFRLNIIAEPNMTYLIQGTTNLVNWTTLEVMQASPGGALKYTDTNSPSFSARYYRTVQVLP